MCPSLSSQTPFSSSCRPAASKASPALRRLQEVPVSFLHLFVRLMDCPAVGHIDLTKHSNFLADFRGAGARVFLSIPAV